MFIYLNLSMMMFIFSIFSMLFMMKFVILNMKLFIEINLMKINSLNFSLLFYFDYKSFMFMMVVLLISSMIVIYSISYMEMEYFKLRFIYLLMMFVISMIFMIFGQNLLMILLGWDGLGLISYCLVIYYNSWGSYNSGMVTILTNRLGDIGLLISIGLYSIYGDWNYLIMLLDKKMLFFMIVLACFTKSAQIPFSSWLPKAMAAPTPISALVHSSTLVTAGIYLLMRFYKILFINKNFYLLILFLSLMTMFFAGMVGMFENDFKKIIALSTLSQLGLMMMSLLLGLKLMSFFHLIIHALFKSLLFMSAGLILHSMSNNQDIRFMGTLNFNYLINLTMFNCANLSLCGFPFLSGFYSKDLILELSIFNNYKYFLIIMFYISILLTVMYSFRLIFYLSMNYMKFFSFSSMNDNFLMNYSMMMMFIFSILGGSLFNWLMFSSLNFIFIEVEFKIFLNLLLLIGMMVSIMLMFLNNKIKLMSFNFFNIFNSMLMMNYLYLYINKNIYKMSDNIYKNIDKGWIDLCGKELILLILKYFIILEKFSMMLLMMIFFFFFFCMMIYF